MKGDLKAGRKLVETVSTSDVPLFLTPAVNALFLAQFANAPSVYDQFTETYTTDRFKNIEWDSLEFSTDDLVGVHDGEEYNGYGLPRVGELSEYPRVNFQTENVPGEMSKYGASWAMSWETSLRTGSFAWVPRLVNRMGQWASETQDRVVAEVMADAAGVINPDFGVAVSGATTNPALTYEAIEDAILQAQSVRVNGRRVAASSFQLVTGYGLSLTARKILETTQIRETDGTTEYIINPTLGGITYTPFDALDQNSGGAAADYWFIIPKGTARPALLSLRHEAAPLPSVFLKSPDATSLAGGLVDPMQGSFSLDAIEAKTRWVGGAAAITPEIIFASDGTESA
jgi:hypothetical protein